MRKQQLQMSFKLPMVIQKDGDMFVSSCPVLDVYSQGASEAKAEENLKEALTLFLETCFEMGTLNDVLKSCGFQPSRRKSQQNVSENHMIDIPLSFTKSVKNAQACAG